VNYADNTSIVDLSFAGNPAATTPKHMPHCSSGPFKRDYSKPGYVFWPTVRIGSCAGLGCSDDDRCVATRTRTWTQRISIFKCRDESDQFCYFVERNYLEFTEDTKCDCLECTSNSDCDPPKSRCDTNTNVCKCPVIGLCPPGYIWDPDECKCVRCPYIDCPPEQLEDP